MNGRPIVDSSSANRRPFADFSSVTRRLVVDQIAIETSQIGHAATTRAGITKYLQNPGMFRRKFG